MLGIFLIGILSWAHGPVIQQASVAVNKATALFLADTKPEIQSRFESMTVELVGDERFLVKVKLKGEQRLVTYACGLDTDTAPPKWGCKKN